MARTISTDAQKINELLERGVARIYPTTQFLKELLETGKQLTLYLGIDPSGPVLHLGHAIILRKLRQFQDLGHQAILLIGDFTAMSGDPDKTEVRKRLTRKEILAHCRSYKKQAGKILRFTGDNPAEYRFNSTWLSRMKFADVVDLAAHQSVQRLLERDLFQRRIKSGTTLYLHEFLYPLMQGYDSVAMNVDGEVGGTDQMFNMLTGRDLMKSYRHKEKFVLTTKLLEDPSGNKMGKTEGNMVTLIDNPNDMFGKIMSWPDEMISVGFELLTDMPFETIKERERSMRQETLNPRDAKAELARDIVGQYHSKAIAQRASREFFRVFSEKKTPEDIATIEFDRILINKTGKVYLPIFLYEFKLCSSRSEARRFIQQGGVKINKKSVSPAHMETELARGDVVQVGKRKFIKII